MPPRAAQAWQRLSEAANAASPPPPARHSRRSSANCAGNQTVTCAPRPRLRPPAGTAGCPRTNARRTCPRPSRHACEGAAAERAASAARGGRQRQLGPALACQPELHACVEGRTESRAREPAGGGASSTSECEKCSRPGHMSTLNSAPTSAVALGARPAPGAPAAGGAPAGAGRPSAVMPDAHACPASTLNMQPCICCITDGLECLAVWPGQRIASAWVPSVRARTHSPTCVAVPAVTERRRSSARCQKC